MKKSTLYLKALVNILLYAIAAVLVVVFVPKLIVFFMPFVIGWIVSAIANPPIKFFEEKIKFKRKTSSAIFIVLILAVIILALYGIVVFLINEGIGLVSSIPDKWDGIQKSLDTFGDNVSKLTANLPSEFSKPFKNFGNFVMGSLSEFVSGLTAKENGTSLISSISEGIGSVANILIGIIMSVLSAYFFAVERNAVIEFFKRHMSKKVRTKVEAAVRGLKNAVGGYFKAQLWIELWVYVITVIGLIILRVDYSVLIGLGIAFLDFLPFFGAGLIMVPWAVVAFVNNDFWIGVGLLITWGVGQLVRQLIQPKIVGDQVGVAPLPTLILLFLGYKWKGVFGMVIALPIAMIFIALYEEHVFDTFTYSVKILWDGLSSFRRIKEPSTEKEIEEKGND